MISSAHVLFSESQDEEATNGEQTGPSFPVGALVGIVLFCIYGAMGSICRFQDRWEKNKEEINATVCLVCSAIIIFSVARFASGYPVGVAIGQVLIFTAVVATVCFSISKSKRMREEIQQLCLETTLHQPTLSFQMKSIATTTWTESGSRRIKSQGILLKFPTKKQPPLSLLLLRWTHMPATI